MVSVFSVILRETELTGYSDMQQEVMEAPMDI